METIVPEGYKKTKFGYVPNEWRIDNFSKVIKPIVREVEKPNEPYWRLGLRSHGKGTFHEFIEDPNSVSMDKLYIVKEDDLIVNITFAWEHAIALAAKKDENKLVSHRFPTYQFTNNNVPLFYKYYVLQPRFKYELENISPGGAGRNRVMSKTDFLKIDVLIPSSKEQTKIAQILTTWDEVIVKQEKLIKEKEQLKKGLIQKLLSGEIRFQGFNEDWKFVKLGDLLDYLQPTQYLVSDTNYSDEYETPVLTAGKTFILGYTNETQGIFADNLPVIIFDDFTTATQFVDFPFKAKSSAMKILKPKNKSVNVKLVYEIMQMINFVADDHKRYWISEYQELEIKLPSKEEQLKISEFLNTINNEINLLKNELEELKQQKKALMQKLLTGQVRVKV